VSDSILVTNPTGGAEDRRRRTQPALHEVLMEGIVAADNMRRAWRQVRRNRGAPGIDGMRVEDFPAYARGHWPTIKQALLDGTYSPQPVRRVSIPKPGGGERLLGIPTVVDRIIQQAIAQVMGPIFDEGFSESSFGFRPRRSAHGALETGTGEHQSRLPHCRRSGFGEVFRQRPARHLDGPSGQEGG